MNITQHCKERYAERIMGYNTNNEIRTFIAQNSEKIQQDLEKMVEFGTNIYTGKLRDKNIVNVYLNNTWVLLTDKEDMKAITIYKIDLKAGEDLNKEFISRQLSKLSQAKEEYAKQEAEKDRVIADIIEEIEKNSVSIKEHKETIRTLEDLNSSLTDVSRNLKAELYEAESVIKQCVADLVCKRCF